MTDARTASITEHLTRVLSLCTPAAPVTLPVPEATGCVLAAGRPAAVLQPAILAEAFGNRLVHADGEHAVVDEHGHGHEDCPDEVDPAELVPQHRHDHHAHRHHDPAAPS